MRLALAAGVGAVLAASSASAQYCPCYTASSPNNTHSCAVDAVAGTNPTVAQWQGIFALVSQGPSGWGSAGPSVSNIGEGCGQPTPSHSVAPRFPCELLKAIAMVESGWKQFCVPTTPSDQVGGASRTIISFDCGYGIGQVTSGMRTFDPTPSFDRARVASDATYNLATGTQILASKWRATNCVGDNLPRVVEHWYSATWAYNGLATSNNPNNAAYSSTRGVWNPSVGGSAPYQEKVFGYMEHPPSASYWPVLRFAYPNPSNIGTGSSPPALPEPDCSTPTNCTAKRTRNVSACLGDGGVADGGVDAGTDAGVDAGADGGRDGGADAGTDAGSDAGPPPPVTLGLLSDEYGAAKTGCGCGQADSALIAAALVVLAARLRRRVEVRRRRR